MLFKLVQVPLDGIPSFCLINCTTHLGVISKLVEGKLSPFMSLIKMLKSTGPRTDTRGTTCVRHPPEHRTGDHNLLAVIIQPVPYPPYCPTIESVSLQLGDKNVVWGDVKGQDEPRSFLFSSLAVELTECYKPSLSILFLE